MQPKPSAYGRFFAQLKRRRVFSSAAVYGGATFAIIQAADFMIPALGLPQAVSSVIAVLALVGFPISMVLAWTFDVTPTGMKVTEPPSEAELEAIVSQPRIRRWPVGIAAVAGLVLFFAGVWLGLEGRDPAPDPAANLAVPSTSSLVVLPFLTLGEGSQGEYLGEGIANELLGALSRVPGLRLTARTSAFAFPEAAADLVAVAEELQVDAFLEGSVERSSGVVELALRLVGVGGVDPVWSRSYRLPEEDFFRGLDDAARSVAAALGSPTRGGRRGVLLRPLTRSFPAYEEYLRGQHLARRGTRSALESALEHYHRALLLDPDFPLAWAGLAMAYVLIPEAGGPPIAEILPYARAALEHVRLSGEEVPEGFAASAYLKWAYLWDLPGAEADFRRSIELDPSNPTTRNWHAQLLGTRRHFDEALAEAHRALELDPRSASAHLTLGLVLMCAGQDGAADALERALELAPDIHPAAYVLGGLLAMQGDLEGAGRAFARFSSLTGTDGSVFRAYLAAVGDPSRRPEAVAMLRSPSFFGPVQGAELLAHLGEHEASLALLEAAVQARSPYLPWVNAMPQYDGIRQNPRFQSILAWIES